jgi:hypothetical protein
MPEHSVDRYRLPVAFDPGDEGSRGLLVPPELFDLIRVGGDPTRARGAAQR